MSYFRSMADIYRRLNDLGLDRKFVLQTILPENWDDTAANDLAGRQRAESSVCNALGLNSASFDTDSPPLDEQFSTHVDFLSPPQKPALSLTSVISLAARMAQLCRDGLIDPLSCWLKDLGPNELREMIMKQHRIVTLSSLLKSSWAMGVPVIPMSYLPAKAASIDAVVDCTHGQPVIVLCSRHTSPAWIIWHLAFALAHIRTLAAGQRIALVDLLSPDPAPEQQQASNFATTLIHGEFAPDIDGHDRITGVKLAALARELSHQRGLDAGSVVSGFALKKNALGGNTRGPADKALINLGIQSGGLEQVTHLLNTRIDHHSLPPEARRFFTAIAGHVAR